ncbi:MAG: aminotransferase class V-fold PLP-dependent enzyme [Thermoleophilia bacterium]|nr:aminotransferase class V-fold PLP-dependent enzyme [Thermoleophilia bacterium]
MNLDAIRAELPVLARCAYLNAGTFGPLPRRTAAAMAERERAELELGRCGAAYWEEVKGLREQARAGFAGLLGAAPEQVALTRSTTEGCNIAVAGLGLGAGDEIVTTDVEHFGLLGALGASPARVRVARLRERSAAEALAAIEAELGPRTRLIALSHVSWVNGHILPVAELARHGIPVLVDGAQSAGAIPVDVRALGCAFYTASGQKWPLGPDQTGALYVASEWHERLSVAFPSYWGQAGYEQTGDFTPAPGAARFEPGGIPAPALAGLVASLGLLEETGPARFERARALSGRLLELLAERVEVVTEPGQGTLVSFRPAGKAAETVSRLAARGVIVRDLPGLGWVRASVGFWTAEAELERLRDALG